MSRVFVIDDNPAVAASVKAALESKGHQVEIATDKGEALFRVTKGSFDVVVCDLFLPLSDPDRLEKDSAGIEFFKQMYGAKSEVPIIVTSYDSSGYTAIIASRGGAFDYLSKPFD